MNILNLFSGLGGNRTLWKNHTITAVEMTQEEIDGMEEFDGW